MNVVHPENRIPVYAAIVAGALLHLALPREVAPGPSWIPIAFVLPLLLPHVLSREAGRNRIARKIGTLTMAALTLFLVGALATLVYRLLYHPSSHHEATLILRAAVPLWMGNVLVFALWYWRLDAGGPHIRDSGHHFGHGFVFPQMTMDEEQLHHYCQPNWRPKFLDYLFLSFNTSTALSPTDTAVLAGWAKGLTMLQSLISILLLVVVAARAVNIL
jgi:uncharacterized membrane protein